MLFRTTCEFFAQVVSLQLRAADDREQLLYRLRLDGVRHHLVSNAAREGSLAGMAQGTLTLFDALESGGPAIYHQRTWTRMGNAPSEAELDGLGEWLQCRPEFESSAIYATDCLARDYPAAAAFADVASGLLALPISSSRRSFLLWFRAETIRSVRWGGNPHDKPTVPGPHGPRLTPRRSFELFVESVRERALPWKSVEIEAAGRLRLFLRELVVDQSERLAALNADLTRSNEDLDAFVYVASHDLKEPLRGIHQYAHQLLEDATFASEDQQKKLNSLMRLTVRMDGLLDSLLHYSRVGRNAIELAVVPLSEVLDEAVEMERWVMAREIRERDARLNAREIELRAALDEAERAIRERDQLMSLVSHDLKTPLSTLVMAIALLQDRVDDGGRPVLEKMRVQALRMDAMIGELIDRARLHAGKHLELELAETDLVQLVRRLAEEHQHAAPSHCIQVHATMDALLGIWDTRRLDRVVNNLLSNAVKYSPSGGVVHVQLESTRHAGRPWAVLRVRDEGIGIASHDQAHVFHWYSRADNARDTTIPGTGVGLAAVRDIVEQHNMASTGHAVQA